MVRRLLFVTDVELLPLDRGMRVRVANLVQGCARAFAVTLVAPAPDDAALRAPIERLCERVVWLGEQPPSRGLARLSIWWAGMRAAAGLRRRGSVRWYRRYAAALHALDLDHYDVVWAERPHIARLFHGVRSRTIIDLDDIEHRRMRKAMKYQPPAAHLWAAEIYRYLLYRRWELSWSQSFLATVVCSEEDKGYLEAKGCSNVVVVPNGINDGAVVPREPRRPRTAEGPLRVVFLGNVGHPSNLDGIEFFVTEVLPLLRATHSDTVLDVVGPSATPALQARFAGRARFLGYVPDLGAELAEYDLLVAPIRFGSGTRVKLLDAMACRIPIVTTRPGAEGLPVVDGEHMLLADGPAEFAEKVLRIKRDPALGRRLVANGGDLVDHRFRSGAIQAQLARWLEGLAIPGGR